MSYRKITHVEKHAGPVIHKWAVGKDGVKEIGEHLPQGPGDVCFYEIMMADQTAVRVFYPDIVHISAVINIEQPVKPGLIVP